MSMPDEAKDAAVRDQLGEQAQAVTGNPAAAGIYGDPAGASQPAVPLDLGSAQRTEVDTDALLARIEQLEAAERASRPEVVPEPEPDRKPRVESANAEVQAAIAALHDRVEVIEKHLGL